MTPVDVANVALLEIGQRIPIASFSQTSPAAVAASTFFVPKTQMLLRAANWDFARAQIALAVWKQAVVNGVTSTNPPPQPWLFSYLYPTDCIKARFIQPTLNVQPSGVPLTTAPNNYLVVPPAPTSIPFVIATDFDANGNSIKVILTNLQNAQLIYTRDLSQVPDQWDALFLAGDTALLASYLINALARNKEQMDGQIALCKSVIDQARTANANEAINNIDHIPDWLRARQQTAVPWAFNTTGPNGVTWDACAFPSGEWY